MPKVTQLVKGRAEMEMSLDPPNVFSYLLYSIAFCPGGEQMKTTNKITGDIFSHPEEPLASQHFHSIYLHKNNRFSYAMFLSDYTNDSPKFIIWQHFVEDIFMLIKCN